ncbi:MULTISPECIES: hypothetical protein [Alphaproteobacteria]|uniref:Uncharacterized protein n=3 Tax=Alphaproteobacteria TaxID=28211 RepID=A0A0P6VFA8_9HYPH|nr:MULTISPECIES: hypothetical protein [Alphaproteobacteria]KPL50682.1 hypothetical protein ABB55_28390 [Prosthecomicrobium hirschii]MBB3889827.1 hypothetical protein [Phenylobacterium haematophilum]PZO90972.1 MAG: hypothetical protein DI623_04985 [Sphingomonas sanxanigenens]
MGDYGHTDETKVYFVRIKDTGAGVGIFWADWSGLDLLIQNRVDPWKCEAAEIGRWVQPSGGILFAHGPVLHEGIVENPGPHLCMLTSGLAQLLFENGQGDDPTPLDFEPLHVSTPIRVSKSGD